MDFPPGFFYGSGVMSQRVSLCAHGTGSEVPISQFLEVVDLISKSLHELNGVSLKMCSSSLDSSPSEEVDPRLQRHLLAGKSDFRSQMFHLLPGSAAASALPQRFGNDGKCYHPGTPPEASRFIWAPFHVFSSRSSAAATSAAAAPHQCH